MNILTAVYLGSQIVLIGVMIVIILRLLAMILYVRSPLPFVPTHRSAIRAIVRSGLLSDRRRIVDLGCGWGTLLAMIRRAVPDAQVRGVELRPFLIQLARWRFCFDRNPPVLIRGDFFQHGIKDADAIVGFWIPDLMPDLLQKFMRECSPGCRIFSVIFALPPHPAFHHQVIKNHGAVVHVYTKQNSFVDKTFYLPL